MKDMKKIAIKYAQMCFEKHHKEGDDIILSLEDLEEVIAIAGFDISEPEIELIGKRGN